MLESSKSLGKLTELMGMAGQQRLMLLNPGLNGLLSTPLLKKGPNSCASGLRTAPGVRRAWEDTRNHCLSLTKCELLQKPGQAEKKTTPKGTCLKAQNFKINMFNYSAHVQVPCNLLLP